MPPDPLATAIHPPMNVNFAVAWAVSSFFWYSEALLLASLRNSFVLDSLRTSKRTLQGERKRTAVQQILSQSPRKTITDLSHHPKKGKQEHRSQQAPESQSDTPQGSSHKSHPRIATALPILPLTKKGQRAQPWPNQHIFLKKKYLFATSTDS